MYVAVFKTVCFSARVHVLCAASGPLAQLVEQLAFNQLVIGSNPIRPTIYKKPAKAGFFIVWEITYLFNYSVHD